jgi:hypothetical protein
MAIDAYSQWCRKQIDDPKAGYPPSQRDVQERFGGWDAAVRAADAALEASDPFEHVMVTLRARSTTG